MPMTHTNGIALRYREFGNRDNQTMVFASSLLWTGEAFSELLSELAKDFHLVIPDLHGHGASESREVMTLEDMTDDFYLLLRTLCFRKVTWFGYSIGGMIGMRLALAHPEVLDSLVLMSTTARLDPPEIKEATFNLWEMFRDGHREDIANAAMKLFFASKTYRDRPELIEQYRTELVHTEDASGMFAAALAAFNRSDIADQIHKINVPTLVMTGREDLAATPAQAKFIAEQIPNAYLEIIEDANHLAGIEKPLEIATVIREFLFRTAAVELNSPTAPYLFSSPNLSKRICNR
jgi:3-oxoadipate enol-lactonase